LPKPNTNLKFNTPPPSSRPENKQLMSNMHDKAKLGHVCPILVAYVHINFDLKKVA